MRTASLPFASTGSPPTISATTSSGALAAALATEANRSLHSACAGVGRWMVAGALRTYQVSLGLDLRTSCTSSSSPSIAHRCAGGALKRCGATVISARRSGLRVAARDRLVLQVRRLRDFIDHLSRVDRVYYARRGGYVLALAGSMMWEGDLGAEDKRDAEELERVLEAKGVEVVRVLDPFELSDYLKSRLRA